MKRLSILCALCMTCLMLTAQDDAVDAADYFSNEPFGWATCADAAGTAYTVDGGMHSATPSVCVLYASGSDDRQSIIDAMKQHDIIVLDGSKGDFIVSSTMKLTDLQHKSIVGRNDARVCTEWYITPEYKAALEAANLEQYSSSSGTGGTLPNGSVVDEAREYHTRLTLIEATGDESEAYRKAGLFEFNSSNENIIMRNLTLVGPGSVDVGGTDLVSNLGGTHMWIDHCTFIDGMDGNLDSGKRTGSSQFVTYSWNIFQYTDRSYSHPYSNGTGWSKGWMQYTTYANCIWGNGCMRRLPQVGDVWLHLLNCYYDCAGNSACCTIGSNCTALIEGNYAASGVKKPVDVSDSDNTILYLCRDNMGYGSYNDKTNTTDDISVPYIYNKVSADIVPLILKAKHGAGATLTEEMLNLPESASTTELQTWNFTAWSTATVDNLTADNTRWSADGTTFSNIFTNETFSPLTANGQNIAETDGLLFSVKEAGKLLLVTQSGKSFMRLNKSTIKFIVPNLLKGDTLTFSIRSANKEEERGVSLSNATPESCKGTSQYTAQFVVEEDGNVTVTPDGGIYLYYVTLTRPQPYVRGDVNGDGTVGIADIVAVTNVMAATTTDADVKARADVNGDTMVGIADIVAITNIMAGK